MVFERQALDARGGVEIRQPDLEVGRVYFICRGCACHTFMTTQWLGCRMYGSEDAIPTEDRGRMGASGYERAGWSLPPDNEDEEQL